MRGYGKKVLVLLGLLFIGIALIVMVNGLTFHEVGTNPSLRNVSVISPFLYITFNQNLSAYSVSSTLNITSHAKIMGKSIYIPLPRLIKNYSYDIELSNILSTTGKTIKSLKLQFVAKDISASNLPKDQQKAILNNKDSFVGPSNDPILSHLPYGNLDFSLSSVVGPGANGSSTLYLQARLLLSHADTYNEQVAVDQYKKEVSDYIKSLGLDPSKYNIQYTVVQPTD